MYDVCRIYNGKIYTLKFQVSTNTILNQFSLRMRLLKNSKNYLIILYYPDCIS